MMELGENLKEEKGYLKKFTFQSNHLEKQNAMFEFLIGIV